MNSFSDRIDLHMHTTVSDGTDTPEEILGVVKEAGILLFSITDHDAVKGTAAIRRILSDDDPYFLSGAEFSCRDNEGKYHILGYGYDPEAESIRRIVEKGHTLRMKKLSSRLDFLKTRFGFSFPEEEISSLMSMDNPGKPHIGNLMVKYGYSETKEEAITKYINQLHFASEYLLPEEAVAGILEGGGIPVLAHPMYGDGDQLILGDDMDNRLRKLMGFGLQGIEAFYSGFPKKLRKAALALADKYDLYVTAGSDYHGRNKMIEAGDTGLTDKDEAPEGLKRFLEAAVERN